MHSPLCWYTYQAWVRTSQISMYLVRTEYRKHDKSTYFRLKVQTFCVTYQYVPVRTEYILFCLLLYRLFYISKGYIPGTCWLWWSMYFWCLILLRARRAAQPVCSRAIQAPAQALNQITLKHWQVFSLRVKDSGFKLGRPWWAAKYLSNPAKFKFRDFIREIKQRANLAWSWAVQMVTGTSTLSSD